MDAQLEEQQYLFDLNGYLVIENVLDTDQVAQLNALIDAQDLAPPPDNFPRFGSAAGAIRKTGPGFLQWGEPFVRLLDHPALLPILRFRLGECFRLERLYASTCATDHPPAGCTPTTAPARRTQPPFRASTTRCTTTA